MKKLIIILALISFLGGFLFFYQKQQKNNMTLNEKKPQITQTEKEKSPKVVDDVLLMKSDYKHLKTVVKFPHKKHLNDLAINCGECHHKGKNEPLIDLKMSDDVQKCFSCHNQPGRTNDNKLALKEKIKFHAEAVHENCVECHKKSKNKNAPKTCSKCHIKEKKSQTPQIEGC